MAREIIDLTAEVRTGTGKGAARQARREGYVPGIVYGDGKEPSPINLNYNYLLKRLLGVKTGEGEKAAKVAKLPKDLSDKFGVISVKRT